MKTVKIKAKAIQLISAVVLLVVGITLLAIGILTEPTGEIHNSVLIAFGEILTFAGSIFGVDYNYRYKMTKLNFNINDDEES